MQRRSLEAYRTELTQSLATEEELSEEDQQLKNELDMMVERLTVGTLLTLRRSLPETNLHANPGAGRVPLQTRP